MKTLKEWFEGINDPEIKTNALKAMWGHLQDQYFLNFFHALNSFTWDKTEQGFEYWNDIENRAIKGETI